MSNTPRWILVPGLGGVAVMMVGIVAMIVGLLLEIFGWRHVVDGLVIGGAATSITFALIDVARMSIERRKDQR
jgi:ABC-type uncharacterized transport system permease subunit